MQKWHGKKLNINFRDHKNKSDRIQIFNLVDRSSNASNKKLYNELFVKEQNRDNGGEKNQARKSNLNNTKIFIIYAGDQGKRR